MDIRSVANYSSSAIAIAPQSEKIPENLQIQQEIVPQAKLESVASMSFTSKQTDEQNTSKSDDKTRHLTKENVEEMTQGLNDFMQSINVDLRFVFHQKMGELMVQAVDSKTNKVLRESPPKELLDTMARIRDFVGALLDKKI